MFLGHEAQRSLCFRKWSVIRRNVAKTLKKHNVWVREYLEGTADIDVCHSIDLSKLNLRVAHDVSNLYIMIINWSTPSSPSTTYLLKNWNESLTAISERNYDRKKHNANRLNERFECRRVENVNLTHSKMHHLSIRHD